MLVSGFDNGILGILAILVVSSLILFHFLLFKEYSRQEKIQIQRLKDFEKLVNLEIYRSNLLSKKVGQLQKIKTKTEEKLEVIKLQIKAIDSTASNYPLGSEDPK